MTDRKKKIGILWGGGLGDLLMIRPLLTAAHADAQLESYFFTTAAHAAELFQDFCAPTTVVLLPRSARGLPAVIKKWRRFFDLVYLGPYPNMKTRMLAHLLQPEKIWAGVHAQADPFILEQVLHDCVSLGLRRQGERPELASLLPWPLDKAVNPLFEKGPFFILHAGAKERWETKSWPVERWLLLTKKLLEETNHTVCFTGVASEEPIIKQITGALPADAQARICSLTSWPMRDMASLISASSGVICHNSGILHVAALLKKKTICITGASAAYWRPPYPWVKNVTADACRLACNRYICPIPFYRAKCIQSITVETVWQAITRHGLLEEAH